MATEHQSRPIGSLNGPWSIALRFMLATWPLVIAWAIWVTSQSFANIAHREAASQYVTKVEFTAAIAAMPPQDWRDLVKGIALDLKAANVILQDSQVRISRIEVILDSLKSTTPKNP